MFIHAIRRSEWTNFQRRVGTRPPQSEGHKPVGSDRPEETVASDFVWTTGENLIQYNKTELRRIHCGQVQIPLLQPHPLRFARANVSRHESRVNQDKDVFLKFSEKRRLGVYNLLLCNKHTVSNT
jgi:hypothetical protein